MKLTIEPKRFQKMIKLGLLYKSKKLVDKRLAEFLPEGVKMNFLHSNVMFVSSLFTPKYFIDYSVEKPIDFVLTPEMIDEALAKGFNDDKMTITTDDKFVHFRGTKDSYSEELQSDEKTEFPIKMSPDVDLGLVPMTMTDKITSQVLLKAEDLFLSESEKYRIKSDGKQIEIGIKNIGEFNRTLQLSKVRKLVPFDLEFDGDYYGRITSNVDGEVWLSFVEDAMVISQKRTDHSITMSLAAITGGE